MRSCLILGCARSGTSLVAGMLAPSGYEMGNGYIEPRPSNPRGFFEDSEVNAINDELLEPFGRTTALARLRLRRPDLRRDQLWLAAVPLNATITATPELAGRIARRTATSPFAFKDPRFSYTLQVWRPFVDDAAFVCVFREPGRTVHSILNECRTQRYLRNVSIDAAGAARVWTACYRHILEKHAAVGDWIFLHYDQLLEGTGVSKLEALLETEVDRQFADPTLRRSPDRPPLGSESSVLYQELCRFAGYKGNKHS